MGGGVRQSGRIAWRRTPALPIAAAAQISYPDFRRETAGCRSADAEGARDRGRHARGGINTVIAARLGISEQSVKNRLTALYRKLGVASRLELVLMLMGGAG
jgi:hypothetical protein